MVTGLRSSVARAFLVLVALFSGAGGILAETGSLSPQAQAQIQALMEEKVSRTPAQQKIDSNLIYEARQRRGLPAAPGVPALQTGIAVGPSGEVVVDITATAIGPILSAVANLGGKVLDSHAGYRSLRASLPLDALERLAARPEVLFIQPKQEGMVNTVFQPRADSLRGVSASLLPTLRPGFSARAAAVRSQLSALLRAGSRTAAPLKTNTSEGVVTHRADLAMSTFGATGAGVNVGVLSDGVDSLAALQGSGDLPAGVTVLAGQAGIGRRGVGDAGDRLRHGARRESLLRDGQHGHRELRAEHSRPADGGLRHHHRRLHLLRRDSVSRRGRRRPSCPRPTAASSSRRSTT